MPRRGVPELTPSKRGRILALREEGYTYREIAEKVGGVSASCCYKTVKRDENHHTRETLPRPGRPPAITPRQQRHVVRSLCQNRFEPYKKISEHVGTVTARQVRDIAHKAGYRRCVARRKPFLTKQAVFKRVAWAKENKGRDWRTVIWTDEAHIETGERPGHRRVTRKPGEEYLPETIAPTFRSGRQSIMVWACIAHGHKGPIIRLNTVPETTTPKGRKTGGGLNGEQYVQQVLEGPLKVFIESLEKERGHPMLVVEDGAPGHRSIVAKHARARLGIQNLDHPPSSPDINCIEPLWLTLKNRVADIPGSANSLDNLWRAVQRVWDEISMEEIMKHVGQMDARVAAIEKAKGWHTRF